MGGEFDRMSLQHAVRGRGRVAQPNGVPPSTHSYGADNQQAHRPADRGKRRPFAERAVPSTRRRGLPLRCPIGPERELLDPWTGAASHTMHGRLLGRQDRDGDRRGPRQRHHELRRGAPPEHRARGRAQKKDTVEQTDGNPDCNNEERAVHRRAGQGEDHDRSPVLSAVGVEPGHDLLQFLELGVGEPAGVGQIRKKRRHRSLEVALDEAMHSIFEQVR